ncbi:MAG: ankyrin repeat domain-containing protein, partial [Leptospiraceae bacterium]|nr:ankyrin repeat domain-containing protein [Leptospiraceae bacterium]
MTRDEALDVIREMKSGMAFSDEENDVFWSYTFDPETNRFSYLEAWTVIGSILESRDYSEEEFTALLVADFDYAGVMHRAFSRGKVAAMDTPAPIKKDGEYHKHVFAAIETGDIKTLQLLLKSAEDLRSLVTEPKARSPLTLACMHGQLPIIQYLLGLGADANQHDGHRETPVFVACNGYKSERIGEIVRLLFEAGAKVPQHEAGSDGAIHYAAMYGSFEAVKLLVEHGAPVNLAGSYGRTPLMYAAADAKSVETIELMLQSGADVNAVNEGGDNALFDAVTRENPSAAVAAKLLDAGLDLEYQHKSYKTILGWAASCGRREIVELLIARGAKVNADIERNESPIAQAMMNGHHEIVKLLLAAGADPESKNYAGWSLLEYATAKKDHDLVREIINRSMQKNNSGQKKSENKDVKSEALAKAAEQGDLTAMQLLVEQGADVNGLSRWGSETPLMKAAYYGQIEAAVWLLDHGADIEARDSRG